MHGVRIPVEDNVHILRFLLSLGLFLGLAAAGCERRQKRKSRHGSRYAPPNLSAKPFLHESLLLVSSLSLS